MAGMMSFLSGESSTDIQAEDLSFELTSVLKECGEDTNTAHYFRCFREKSRPLVSRYGVNAMMSELEYLNEESGGVASRVSCHNLGHVVGELGIELQEDAGEVLASCTRKCGFGCTHGAALGVLRLNPNLLDDLPSVCEKLSPSPLPGQDLTACNHGLGHGLASMVQFDLVKTLNLCDLLDNTNAQNECATGVFMEIFDAPTESHPRLEIPQDIPRFCQTLPGIYADLCLKSVGGFELKRSNNIQKAFQTCESISPLLFKECNFVIGADLFFLSQGRVEKIWEACKFGKQHQKEACVEGAIFSSFVTDPSGSLGGSLCGVLEEELQRVCFVYLGQNVEKLHGEGGKESFCNMFGPSEAAFCFDEQ